jgi:hypothetical protein
MNKKHEWLTEGIPFAESGRIFEEYEAAGWEIVSVSWDSNSRCFMAVWKRPSAAE